MRRHLRQQICLILCVLLTCPIARGDEGDRPGAAGAEVRQATQWAPIDLVFTAAEEHSWKSFPLQAVFTSGDRRIALDGFWDGGDRWVVRFAPPAAGRWEWETSSTDSGLGGRRGAIDAAAPSRDEVDGNPNLRGHLRASESGHYFEYADGTPFLILADTKWGFNSTGHRVDDGSWRHYIDVRERQGFNTICLRIWSNDSPNEGGQAFLDNDGRPGNGRFEELNPAYFQSSDRRARMLWERGFVLAAFPDWFGKIDISVADAESVSRYMLACWNAYNLIWALSGEYHRNFVKDIAPWDRWESWHAVGRSVQQHNPYRHPVSAHPSPWGNHPEGQVSTSMDLQDSGWLDHHWMQSKRWELFNRIPLYSLRDYRLTPHRPTLFTEGLYETQDEFGLPPGVQADAYHIRLQAWASLLSGAAGTTYGHDKARGGDSYEPEMLTSPGAEDFKHLADFFERLRWWELVPCRDRLQVDGRVPELQEDDRRLVPYPAAIDGRTYAIYIPGGHRAARLTLTHLGGGYRALWFNPRTGEEAVVRDPIAADEDGRAALPEVPDDEDWVLLLTAIDA